jgi:thiamine kinase-like enzyme
VLAQGGDWFIETWGGETLGTHRHLNDSADIHQVARLLASIHQISPQWYSKCRADLCAQFPALNAASAGSHIWWYTFRPHFFKGISASTLQEWISAGQGFAPRSPAGARVVTCHGDFHPANMVKYGSELKVIDFECTCVASAILDISWAFELWLQDETAQHKFAESYLRACGYPAAEDDIHTLVVDARNFRNCLLFGSLARQVQETLAPTSGGGGAFLFDDGIENADCRGAKRREKFNSKKSCPARSRDDKRQKEPRKGRR